MHFISLQSLKWRCRIKRGYPLRHFRRERQRPSRLFERRTRLGRDLHIDRTGQDHFIRIVLIGVKTMFTADGYKETILELAPERRNALVGAVTGGCGPFEDRAQEIYSFPLLIH